MASESTVDLVMELVQEAKRIRDTAHNTDIPVETRIEALATCLDVSRIYPIPLDKMTPDARRLLDLLVKIELAALEALDALPPDPESLIDPGYPRQ